MLRDLDLLKGDRAGRETVSACLSVPTLDEKAWRATGAAHAEPARARLEAVAELNRAGIPTGILIAPLMPGINDAPEQVAKIVGLATEAGATSIGGNTLFLRGSVRKVFFDWLREQPPGPSCPATRSSTATGAYAAQARRSAGSSTARLPGRRRRKRRAAPRFERSAAPRRRSRPPQTRAEREAVRADDACSETATGRATLGHSALSQG